jgi:predicted transcriptional regulator
MQTRYQLVQTYFINISTTNHRARAVRIHPSRAVFRKDEKFSEPLYILGGNPKKSSSNARKQKAKERGISRSIHARAIQTMLYHLSLSLSLSLEKLIIIADDNKRECSALTFAILFLCLCSMF